MKLLLKYFPKRILPGFIILILIGILIPIWANAGDASGSQPPPPAAKKALVIGKVTENPKKHYSNLKPIADYAVSHMKDLGIQEAKVLIAKNNRQMVSYLKQGKVDWLTETVFSSVYFRKKVGTQILLKKWKKGVGQYHTLFFTRKDSGINTLSDLKGKSIAFEDPGSTSAYYVPASILIGKGLSLVQLATVREKPSPDMVGYIFSGQEVNTATWVYRGLVEAGAFNNLDWNKDDHMHKAQRKEMKIIHKSRPFPRAVELVRKNLDPLIKERLKTVLLNSHNDPKARAALNAYQETKKFEELGTDDLAAIEEAGVILNTVNLELD